MSYRADVRVEVFEDGPGYLRIRLTGNRSGLWVEGRCGDNASLFCFTFLRLWLLASKLQPASSPRSAVSKDSCSGVESR